MDIRPIEHGEIEAFYTMFFRSMGFGPPNDTQLEREKRTFMVDRSLAAFDRDAIVATTYSHLFELTLPGRAQLSVAGVTAVGVASTHRRRGLVTELMRRQLAEARERGEPAALLIASEGKIYGRFGYGAATFVSDVKIRTQDAQFAPSTTDGRVVIVDGEVADKIFPDVYDRARRTRAGSINRPQRFWDTMSEDRDKRHVHVVYEDATGEPRGYARYAVKADWNDALPTHELTVHELTAIDDTALIDLWRYLLSVDLVREIDAWARPPDDPLRWVLGEPRAVRSTTYRDMYWLRPLDAPRLLGARRYSAELDLRLRVVDPLLGRGQTLFVSAGPDGAHCSTDTGEPDLAMSMSELGSILLGGVAPSELARAGRIDEVRSGALARADAAFVTYPRPWGNTFF